MTEREMVINFTDAEAIAWINEYPTDSAEFIRRHNVVYFECGLTRAGIKLEPTTSGELIMDTFKE